jgi:glycerate-2-kinase
VIPENVKLHLERAEVRHETPKSSDFESIGVKSISFILAKNEDSCEAIVEKANQLGYNPLILTTKLEGESKDVGVVLSAVAKEVEANNRPIYAPCILISGGETTVTIIGDCGEGGRNQELALSAALKIAGREKIVLASIGTDGTDGPTEIAGAIVDGYTLRRAEKIGLDLGRELRSHNSSHVFRELEDAIYTGPTGTNVMDIQVVVVTS